MKLLQFVRTTLRYVQKRLRVLTLLYTASVDRGCVGQAMAAISSLVVVNPESLFYCQASRIRSSKHERVDGYVRISCSPEPGGRPVKAPQRQGSCSIIVNHETVPFQEFRLVVWTSRYSSP
ncbi:hypothetical protein DK37_07935 [Halomonas sp. SUBG004]|nr:hypothetical protein DK37_07935 [Halomonas sp. SUBG004]